MKKIIAAVALCAASVSSHAGFTTGNEFLKWSAAYDSIIHSANGAKNTDITTAINASKFVGYVTAVADTASDLAICPSEDATREQMIAIVQKYMRDNPENWNVNASALVLHSLMQAFPCKKK